jgi:thiol-disulfide isomerase/thioredoxin
MACRSVEAATETAALAGTEAVIAPAPASPHPVPARVTFEPIKYEAFLKALAKNDAKYTIVDCWASWCGPCKENFPHVLDMHKKYGDKGLKVLSLSFDGGTGETELDTQEIASAKAFLTAQKAEITNYLLDEERDMMFERFDILAIPAVFVYDADGKEVKRYTWDDPSNQFTYEQVEKEVAELLGITPE